MIQAVKGKRDKPPSPKVAKVASRQTEPAEPAGQLLTTDQVAEILGVKPLTLVRWRHSRKGPSFIKVGGSVRYRSADVDQWVAGQKVETEQGL